MSRTHNIVLSTAFLPPVSYMHHIYLADELVIEKKENFQKQTYRNRFEIMGANGKLALSVPVIKVRGNHTPVDEILVSDAEPWEQKFRKAIESAYNSSPFFMYYKEEIFAILEAGERRLFELNYRLLAALMKLLGIEKDITLTKEYHGSLPGFTDLRESITPKTRKDELSFKPYVQVFSEKHGFMADLSIIDLLFNEGPAAADYLKYGISAY